MSWMTAAECERSRRRLEALNSQSQLPRPVDILVNLAFSLVPTVPTTTMMTTLMRPAISPYSMAVAPDVSAAKRRIKLDMICLRSGWKRPQQQARKG